jgi:hypothetical protein
MNKLQITGLALLCEAEKGSCSLCNYDFSWVFNYPSTLLWVDKIILSPGILKIIDKEHYPDNLSLYKVLHMFFDIAGEYGLIEIKNPKGTLTADLKDKIKKQVKLDRTNLAKKFPEHIKKGDITKVPGELLIGDYHFCSVHIEEIYFNLIMSRIWDTNLLLNDQSKEYLKYRFGNNLPNIINMKKNGIDAFAEIFSSYIPELNIYPASSQEKCTQCNQIINCRDKELKTIEKNIRTYIKYRDYDELQELKDVYNQIAIKSAKTSSDSKDIINHFRAHERKLRKKMVRIFPKVERWSKLITIMSLPIAVVGISTQNPLIGSIGAGIASISTALGKYVEIMKSKQSWLFFNQTSK